MKNEIDKINCIASARRVLKVEASALSLMADELPDDFVRVVDAILQVAGRIIVSGVGKSGHIGNKIAATLASTGTPAQFVHATEASHGDLGMVTNKDLCLLISNSGETSELRDIVAHTRRFGIKMAAISSRPDSTLMKAADYKLTLPNAPEACSIGMAPTTSTTMTLALGDALAVVLMERRKFEPDDFKVFHPGGKLGSHMATVKQLMRGLEELAIISGRASVREAVLRMTETGFGVAICIDDSNHLCGIISDGDLRRNLEKLLYAEVMEIATIRPVSVSPNDTISVALNKMETSKIFSIVVVENEQPVGLLRMHDLLRSGFA